MNQNNGAAARQPLIGRISGTNGQFNRVGSCLVNAKGQVFQRQESTSSRLCSNTVRNINNPMANWKVIVLISGNIEAVSGPAAHNPTRTHLWLVRQGKVPDKAEALQSAEKADPRVDLEWMRIRYERHLSYR